MGHAASGGAGGVRVPQRRAVSLLALVALLSAGAVPAQEGGAPLSAIDWLSRSVETPTDAAFAAEPPVTDSASTPQIVVTPLDQVTTDTIGLLAPETTGLPRSLWSASAAADVAPLVATARPGPLPALSDLVVTLMLAEADPPRGATADGAFFLTRVDKLLDLARLEQAREMIEEAGLEVPDQFRRWFDIALLTGTEDPGCRMMAARPELAPTLPARVFCLAREGDWQAAALTLNTARALGDVSDDDDILLSSFLDPALAEESGPLPPAERISPLVFRLREAVGEGMTTTGLPRAFAHADLRDIVAWRARIEAAERLSRTGAIPAADLFALYRQDRPAASGGVWDRAAAIQALDAALVAAGEGDAAGLASAVTGAWAAMQGAHTEVAFGEAYGATLVAQPLDADAGPIAFRAALLGPGYERAALAHAPAGPRERFLGGVARGDVAGLEPAGPKEEAVARAFDATPGSADLPEDFRLEIEAGKVGEALLRIVATASEAMAGDYERFGDALVALRVLGLEDAARRAALQFLILERPA